ncbi:MAG: dTMP kinase [Gemmatimonadaceae bacterium]
MARGRLIVLEGPEGAGKTTQQRMLAGRLKNAGHEVLALREPGGTPLGDSIRAMLLDSLHEMTPAAEALLFMASRAEIVSLRIDPALRDGVVVLMDRFFLSTYAYQIAGRGLDETQIRQANALATAGHVPDLTIVIDVPPEAGLARAEARGSKDRMERADGDFHSKVSRAFSRFATEEWQKDHPECGPIVKVNGTSSPEQVQNDIVGVLAQNLPEHFSMLVTANAG